MAGSGDYDCSEEVQKSAENLVHLINSDQIIVNQESGALVKATDLKTWLQFDPLKNKDRQEVFKSYINTGVLPKQWSEYKSLDELISKSGIEKEIDERIKLESMSLDDFVGGIEKRVDEHLAEIALINQQSSSSNKTLNKKNKPDKEPDSNDIEETHIPKYLPQQFLHYLLKLLMELVTLFKKLLAMKLKKIKN